MAQENLTFGSSGKKQADKPLVSVIIPTHNRVGLLVGRAIPSVLSQTYQNFELIVVADRCSDGTRERVLGLKEPRIRFVELKDRPPLPDDLRSRWRVASGAPRNRGLELATGEWITLLDDDDEFTPDHIEVMLKRAFTGYDFVYGKFLCLYEDGSEETLGSYPPEHGRIGASSFIYSSKYRDVRCNTDAAATWEPGDWNLFRRIIAAGARMSFVDEVVYVHHVPVRDWEVQRQALEYTGEMFLPWQDDVSGCYEHLHRYAFASWLVGGKVVLDLASGEGYGSNILAKVAKSVVGVEIDGDTVAHASLRYGLENLKFLQGSMLDVPIDGSGVFDVIVCFEAIEHVVEHDRLLSEVKRLLKKDGLFVVSTPDRKPYSDEPGYRNQFHLKELYRGEFEGLLGSHFSNLRVFGQRVYCGSNIWDMRQCGNQQYMEFVMDRADEEFCFVGDGGKTHMYLIALASDADLPKTFDSWLVDSSNSLIKYHERHAREMEMQLSRMGQGIAMQILGKYQIVAASLLGKETRRRYFYELALSAVRVLLNEGWRSLLAKAKRRLIESYATRSRNLLPNLYRVGMATQAGGQPPTKIGALAGFAPVDIVTVTHNSARFVEGFVRSIQEMDYPKELLTLAVVDNCSSDDTIKTLCSMGDFYGRLRLVPSSLNLGYGAGVNMAAKLGKSPYIFVVNPDVKLDSGCLAALVGKALGDTEAWLWEARQLPYEHPKYYDPVSLETIWSSGAAFLVRRDRFEEVGGFDESLFLYADDVDLSFRIWNLGGKCRYVPWAILWHFTYSSPGEVKPLQWQYSIRNNLLLRHKFGRINDIARGYILLASAFLLGNAGVRNARLRLLGILFSHLRLVPKMLLWRLRNRGRLFGRFSFFGWDYEARRLGDFHESRPCVERPLVSVIVRTKGRPYHLRNALTSIANQTYRPIEVVVVEDGPAGSRAVVGEFEGVSGLAIHYHALGTGKGRCVAGNEGLGLATGEFINFLDDDDLLYPDHIETLLRALQDNWPIYKCAYSASFEVEAAYTDNGILPNRFKTFFNRYSRDDLKTRNLFPIQSVLFSRELYDSLGGLDIGLEALEDWDLWLRYAKATDFLAVEKTTSEFRVPGDKAMKAERQARSDLPYWFLRRRHELL